MKRMLSGIKPTGRVTLGNYIGAIKPFVSYQDEYEMIVFVANLHSMTIYQEPKDLRKNTKDLISLYLAAGHFEFGKQRSTVITYEYPDDFEQGKEPYYPVNDEKNNLIFKQYQELAQQQERVLFGGRLAQYTYADMDDTVAAALKLWKKESL